MDFDINNFVKNSTITLLKSPIQQILDSKMQPKEKLRCLQAMEHDHREFLQEIQKTIRTLENQIRDGKNE